jgi:hypothetical protein
LQTDTKIDSPINLRDYTAGGYFITKYAHRKNRISSELLPERLVSLSSCISNLLPVFYGWKPEIDQQYALDFGIAHEKLSSYSSWSNRNRKAEIGYPDIFYSLEAAREFITEYLPSRDDLLLLGVGLHNTLVKPFLKDNKPQIALNVKPDFYERWELDPAEQFGMDRLFSLQQPLPPGGVSLGFDVVCYDKQFVCSWLCLVLEYELDEKFGIRVNSSGLFNTFDEAKIAHSLALSGEDIPYYPFLVVQYNTFQN